MSSENESSVPPEERRRRKLYMKARELQLTKEDRIDLTQYLLRRDITSWKDLSDQEVSRLLDAFEGFELISFIQGTTHEQRPREAFDPAPSES